MKNNYYSKKDDMRPFIVKKMNTPSPTSSINNNQNTSKHVIEDEKHTLSNHRITDEHVYEVSGRKDRGLLASMKPLIISGLSAISIGVLLGIVVLRMSTGAADPATEHQIPSSQVTVPAEESKEEEQVHANELLEIDAIHAYVLQAGVYSAQENANEMANELQELGYSHIVWEQNGQFFVFTNVFSSEEYAKQVVGEIEDIEVYAKEWRAGDQAIDIPNEDKAFLDQFIATWTQTVEEHTANEFSSLIQWENLTEDMPETDSSVQHLTKYLTEEIVQAESAIDIEQLLLDTWKIYSSLE